MSKDTIRQAGKVEERRGGLGVRFWNFVGRASIGPVRDVQEARRTGARI